MAVIVVVVVTVVVVVVGLVTVVVCERVGPCPPADGLPRATATATTTDDGYGSSSMQLLAAFVEE